MSETLNAQDIAKKLQEQLTSLSATVDTHEVSTVDEVGDGIARVSGLKSAMAGELLSSRAPIPVRPSSALPRALAVTRSAPFCSVPSTPSRKATSAAPLAALWISP